MVVALKAVSGTIIDSSYMRGGLFVTQLIEPRSIRNLLDNVWLNSLKLLSKAFLFSEDWVTLICFDAETKDFLFTKGVASFGKLCISSIIPKLSSLLDKESEVLESKSVFEASTSLQRTRPVLKPMVSSTKGSFLELFSKPYRSTIYAGIFSKVGSSEDLQTMMDKAFLNEAIFVERHQVVPWP